MQPFLDLTNYDRPHDPSMYDSMQQFLRDAPRTDGRFGFNPASTFSGGTYIQSFLTPYGLQVMEGHYVKLFSVFGEFNFKILKELCESPLPDASVINLVDNAVRILQEQEPGEPTQYTMTHVGHINPYGHREGKLTWSACGCDCLIEWDGRCMFLSLDIAHLLSYTGRLTVIPLAERMCPRHGCMHELKHYKHPNAVDWRGKPITEEMIEAAIAERRKK